MKIKSMLAAAAIAAACNPALAGTLLSEGFEDVNTLAGKGWTQDNRSSPIGPTIQFGSWFQGDLTAFSAASGAPDSYIATNFNSGFAGSGGTIDNWLFLPTLPLATGVTLSFDLRLNSSLGFVDTVELWLSNNGSSISAGDYTLVDTYTSTSDTGWQGKSINLTSYGDIANGRFAFRYVAANSDVAADYIGIDNVLVVPEPTSLALVGLALIGATAATRRRKV